MKGSREHKKYISVLRRLCGKKNGVIPSFAMDDLRLFKLESDKRRKLGAPRYD